MLQLFKRDHFILGYESNGILFIKNGQNIAFDTLKRFGYDPFQAIDQTNTLFPHAEKIKAMLFMPMRKNIWRSPFFTIVCAHPLSQEHATHLYRFCELIGGINITVSYVSSVKAFLEKPSLKLVRENYVDFR